MKALAFLSFLLLIGIAYQISQLPMEIGRGIIAAQREEELALMRAHAEADKQVAAQERAADAAQQQQEDAQKQREEAQRAADYAAAHPTPYPVAPPPPPRRTPTPAESALEVARKYAR